MTPEQQARQRIDQQLEALGWRVQQHGHVNRYAALGVAVREVPTGSGPVDYALYVDERAAGVIEAKRADDDPQGIDDQSSRYVETFDYDVSHWRKPLPFVYESNGHKTMFRDLRDPAPRQRRVFTFHRPEALLDLLQQPDTFRARLKTLPPIDTDGLRENQVSAIVGLERSLAEGRPRALIQAATGSGKTFTAITACYRLIKHARAKRILFLVDRANLGIQAEAEFKSYQPPGEPRKFTELYTTQRLQSRAIDPQAQVEISTIQRVYGVLTNDEVTEEIDEGSSFEREPADAAPVTVGLNPSLLPDHFDLIIVDECHRSIYNKWRSVLEYFDAFLVGLTATSNAATYGFFEQNVVSEYTHDDAVRDGVNVPYRVFRIKTRIGEGGGALESGYTNYLHRHRKTRAERWGAVDDATPYSRTDLDRSIVAEDQIRTVIKEFKRVALTELFPGRKTLPKTLVFAKDDHHADNIIRVVLQEFDEDTTFCRKVTYRADDPAKSLSDFQFKFDPRVAVTVDMIATGTDIKPLEVVLFMRDVKSLGYYEQMKGRGVRVIDAGKLKTIVGNDTESKDYFVIVDAVGVTENPKVESGSTEREPSVPLAKLLQRVADGKLDENTLTTLATRLKRLETRMSETQLAHIETLAGQPLNDLGKALMDASNPDLVLEQAKREHDTDEPTPEQLKRTLQNRADAASRPLAASPELRDALQARPDDEIIYDHVSKDAVLYSGVDTEKAQGQRQSFRDFLSANRDHVTALQILYSQPRSDLPLTLKLIEDLSAALRTAGLSTPAIWSTVAQLEPARVKKQTPTNALTDLVSLIRFELGQRETLLPFADEVQLKLEMWLSQKEQEGVSFTDEQRAWLKLMAEQIGAALELSQADFKTTRFAPKGGIYRAFQVFGRERLLGIVDELNRELTA